VPEVAAPNTVPVASNVRFTTASPSKATGLQMAYDYSDADSDPESGTTIEWSRNGGHVAAHDGQTMIGGASLNRGEEWAVSVTPNDGTDAGSKATSSTASIVNAPPSVSNVLIAPGSPVSSDQLVVSYAYADLDGDAEGATLIEWQLDGVRVEELDDATTVSSVATRSADEWRCIVSPVDSIGDIGPLESSQTVIIGDTNIQPVVSDVGFVDGATEVATDVNITAVWSVSDVDGGPGPIEQQIEWNRSGSHDPALDDMLTLPASATSRGDVWSFRVRTSDGLAWSEWVTSPDISILNTAPTISGLMLTPAEPSTIDDLTVTWSYADIDGDAEASTSITWYRDGVVVTVLADATTVAASMTSKGQSWSVEVSLGDGTDQANAESSGIVNVSNSRPVVDDLELTSDAEGEPDSLHPLTLSFNTSDADADPVTTSIKWMRNGFSVTALADSSTVPPEFLAVGQMWIAQVTASDGSGPNTTVTSSMITLANLLPTASFTSPDSFLADSAMTLNGTASTDADGDIVAWFWTVAGVRYGGDSVTVSLPVGSVLVNLTVLDENGGEASVERTITVIAGPTVTDLAVAVEDGMVDLRWAWSGDATNFTVWRSIGAIDGAASLTGLEAVGVTNVTNWSEPMHIVGSHGYAVTVEVGGVDNLRIDATANAATIELSAADLPTEPEIEGESGFTSALVVIWLLLAGLAAIGISLLDRRGGA